jgi:hypothetical protein
MSGECGHLGRIFVRARWLMSVMWLHARTAGHACTEPQSRRDARGPHKVTVVQPAERSQFWPRGICLSVHLGGPKLPA